MAGAPSGALTGERWLARARSRASLRWRLGWSSRGWLGVPGWRRRLRLGISLRTAPFTGGIHRNLSGFGFGPGDTPGAACASGVSGLRTIDGVVGVGAGAPTSTRSPRRPPPPQQPPAFPAKQRMKVYVDGLLRDIVDFHQAGHTEEFCWDRVAFGAQSLSLRQGGFMFPWQVPDNCELLIWKYLAAKDAMERDPPDPHYTQIALPEPWPGPEPPARSNCAKTNASCTRLAVAARAYALADMHATTIWEAVAITANRWGTARATFYTSASAPAGLALQRALLKAYWGELSGALASESRAGQAAVAALRAAHQGPLRLLPGGGAVDRRYLARLQAPGWLIRRLVSAGPYRARRSLALLGARRWTPPAFRRASLPARSSRSSSVPEIPGETYGSMTFDDLYWIADAVRGTAGHAALTKDVLEALGASRASQQHAALESFLAYAKHHESGQLSILLQTAVKPLLG